MVHTHTSKNGLRIVLEQVPAVRSVTIGIWVLAGSRYETLENNGISHFLEHMFFKGTQTRSAQEIAEAFDSIGGHVNAFTSKEYTCYYIKVIDTHKEYALNILADMFFNSSFDDIELEREKKVVLEEIKMAEDTPDDIIHDLLAKASYGDHPLSYPILGTDKHLNTFTKAMIHDYIEERYTPENIVISVAGNVDESFIQTIDGYFGQFTKPANCSVIDQPIFQTQTIQRKKDTEQAHLCLGYNGLRLDDCDATSLVIMNNILGGSMSSRLFQEVREKRGLAYSVFSYHSSHLDSGFLTIYGGTSEEQLPYLQETINQVLDNLIDQGITSKELLSSKEQLKGNLVLGLESTNSRMSRNGRSELLLKRQRTLDETIQEINAVNESSVQRVIHKVFEQQASSALIAPGVHSLTK